MLFGSNALFNLYQHDITEGTSLQSSDCWWPFSEAKTISTAVLAKCSPLSSCPGYLRSPATPPFGYKSSQTLARCCSARVPHFAQGRITFHWWVKQCFCVLQQCLVYGSEDQALWADVGTGEGTQPTHADWKRWDKRAAGVNQPSPKEKTENRKQTIW